MPLYEITLEQSYYGQQIINRWNYQADAVPSGVSGAFKALVGMGFTPDTDVPFFGVGTVAYELQSNQVPEVIFIQAVAKNLYSVTDFYTYAFPPGVFGSLTGTQGESPTTAIGFTSDRTRSDIRRAQKRFVGVGENQIDGGGQLTSSAKTAWQTLGDAMGDINVVPAGSGAITFTPYVFGRLKYHPTGKTTWAYKYYPTETEQLDHIAKITAFNLKFQTRTQTSRQYGRGA